MKHLKSYLKENLITYLVPVGMIIGGIYMLTVTKQDIFDRYPEADVVQYDNVIVGLIILLVFITVQFLLGWYTHSKLCDLDETFKKIYNGR